MLAALASAVVLAVGIVTAVAVTDSDDRPTTSATADQRRCLASVRAESTDADVGDAAPTFTLPGLDDVGCVRFASFRGAPLIVNFWASWCNPCRREFPILQDAYDEHRAEGLEIVGITYRDIEADAQAFALDARADWLLAHDEDEIVAKSYGVNNIPQTFFIRADGTIAARVFGPLTRADLDDELSRILPRR